MNGKERVKKLFAIIALFVLMINSSFLTVISTAIDAIENKIDESKIIQKIEMNIEKYVNYNVLDESKGTLLQLKLKTGIEYDDGQEYVPIKATKTELNMPQIEGKYPENVEVLFYSTKATNGDETGKDASYVYDQTRGKLEVTVENKANESGDIYTEEVDGARDEFVVIANYGEECYNGENKERVLNITGNLEQTLANEDTTVVNEEFTADYQASENVSGLISTQISTSDIYNGYINSNKQNGTQYETEYTENIKIDVSYENIAEELKIETENKFINKEDEEVETEEILYKSTKINKQNVLDILGNEGSLQILNESGDVLGEVNKSIESAEDGTVEINYESELNEIIIKTTKPEKLGIIELENKKTIKSTMTDLENDKILVKHQIKCENNVEELDEETQEVVNEYKQEVYSFENKKEIEINESITSVELKADKNGWTNIAQNDVVFTATLVSNGSEYNLFKNPVIEIKLPSEVEKVILGTTSLLYANNELSIKSSEVVNDGDCKKIRIVLDGTQTTYSTNSIYKGTEVIVPATVILKKDITSTTGNVELIYTNETKNEIDYELSGQTSKNYQVNLVDELNNAVATVSENEEFTGELETEITAMVGDETLSDGDTVYEGEIITYKIKISNNTEAKVNNVNASVNIPEGTVYVTEDGSWITDENSSEYMERNPLFIENENILDIIEDIDVIESGECYEKTFQVKVKGIENGIDKQIDAKLNVKSNDFGNFENELFLIAKDAKLKVEVYPADDEFSTQTSNLIAYTVDITNISEQTIENVILETTLEKEWNFYFAGGSNETSFDKETRKLTIKLDDFNASTKKTIGIRIAVENFTEGVYEYDIPFSVKIYGDDTDIYRSNEQIYKFNTAKIFVKQTSETEGENLVSDQEIQYNITVKNTGKVMTLISIIDNLPEGLRPLEATYDIYEFNENINDYEKVTKTIELRSKMENNDFYIKTFIYPEELLNIVIKAQVDKLEETTDIENVVTVSEENTGTILSNIIKNKIMRYGYVEEQPDEENPDPEEPGEENPNEGTEGDKTYSISGLVWLDSNKNAQRDTYEEPLEGITVKLFNAETNSIVVDKNGNIYKINTSINGQYEFTNVKSGNYLVLFEYDTSKYDLTTYQKNGVTDSVNSDAVLKEVNIDGEIKSVGVSDIIQINSMNMENIDIGLIQKNELDISIEKYITKVTVENSEGTKEYTYDKTKLAKVEIPAKLINDSKIQIEYTIVVKNIGKSDAYITQVLDEIPETLQYDSDLNKEWTLYGKNAVYKNLSGINFKENNSKEIKLVLTKELNGDSVGVITNNASILEYFNNDNLQDIDTGNNSSDAQIIISIKTGVSTIIFISFCMILFVAILIILLKNKKIALSLSMIIVCIFFANGVKETQAWYTVDPPYIDLTYKDLGGHVNRTTNTWEVVHSGKSFWCMAPGKHFGTKATTADWDKGEYAYYGKCSGGHYYKKGNINNDSSIDNDNYVIITYQGEDGRKSFTQKMSKNGTYVTSVFNSWFKTSMGTADAQETSKPTDYQYDIKDGNCLIGPFEFKYTTDGATVQSKILIVKDGTKDITYEVYKSDKQTRVYNVNDLQSNSEFYLKVPSTSTDVTVQLKTTFEIEKTEGKVTATEYRCVGTYGYCYDKNGNIIGKNQTGVSEHIIPDCQPLLKIIKDTVSKTDTVDVDCYWTWKNSLGSITITKKDADTGTGLTGATFKITGPNSYSKTVSMTSSSVTIKDLLLGTYTITETGAPSGYNINLQSKVQTVNLTLTNKNGSKEFKNRKYGDLQIVKTDKDTGKILQNAGVKFIIKDNSTKKYIKSYTKGTPSTLVYTTNKSEAYKFTTGTDGKTIVLENIPQYPTYTIEEVELPSSLTPYYEVSSTVKTIKLNNNATTTEDTVLKFDNKQVYTYLSGYVWEDVHLENKPTILNNLYKANSEDKNDKIVSGVIVRLKKKDGTIVSTTTTNDKGEYIFAKVKITELSNYFIEFEYNGLKYTNVTKNLSKTNGSKAIEIANDRTVFNNSYANITGGTVKESNTTGYSKNTSGTITNNLTYKNGTYTSSLVQNTGYTTASAKSSVTAKNGSSGVIMKADTSTAGHTITWSAGVRNIQNLNLGLKEREQPDMAITADLDNIGLSINGYKHTYIYDQRIKATGIDIFSEITKWNTAQKDLDSKGYPTTYTRSIYSNYVYASGIKGQGALNDENKLQVYLTYKIVIKNESSSLYMSANEIVNYYDKTLDLVESWYQDSNNNKVNVAWTQKGDSNGYNQIRTTSLKDVKLAHGESIIIYVKTKKNTVLEWAEKDSIDEKTYNVTEITSYSTYQKDDNGKYVYYAGIDKDSAPDNIIPGQGTKYTKRYEDDTDAAPVVEITFESPRVISGYVFEDVAEFENGNETELHTGEQRIGDGKYDASEDGYVANVKVELVRVSDNGTAYIYPNAVSASIFNAEKAEYTTTSETTETKQGKGYYEFIGVIPGEYYLKYTYGDGTVIYKATGGTVDVTTQDYKSTIITSEVIKGAFGSKSYVVDQNPRWYQDSINIEGYSAAVDDYDTREKINKALEKITYQVKTQYDSEEGYIDLKTMTARTPNMSIAIENKNNETTTIEDELDPNKIVRVVEYDNINFGIIERPRQSIETTKEINFIKLTLANGQTLVEGDPRSSSLRYVTYPERGSLKIEVDSEIIEGATLEINYEITITNKSEIDYKSENNYNAEKYYKYGYITGLAPVSMTINSIVDYMDENLKTTYTYDGDASGWKLVKASDLRNSGLISIDVNNTVKNNHNILVNECNSILKPGESMTINVSASKLLSTSAEMLYRNYVEALTVSNSAGRFYGQEDSNTTNKWINTTPGNLDIADSATFEKDSNYNDSARKAELSIIPPTGQDRNVIVIIIGIGIGVLILLAGGIVLIKRKFKTK